MDEQLRLRLECAFNEGMMFAVQLMASEAIRTVDLSVRMLPNDKTLVKSKIKSGAERILRKRNLIPSQYDVVIGKAEPIELDFNMEIK